VVATVGRLSWEKGQDVLLRSVPAVAAALPEVRFLLCGTGPEEGSLRRLAQGLRVADRVEFLGFAPDVRPVLASAAIFAMPSRSEGLGVAVLEAMAMGNPVVASDVGGLRDSVLQGETGLRVPADDPEALAEALLALLQSPERARQMGAAGRARALEQYDRPRVVDHILDLYHEVLSGG
jgi:glycosyltransferase involved in cell wall biosynthesis